MAKKPIVLSATQQGIARKIHSFGTEALGDMERRDVAQGKIDTARDALRVAEDGDDGLGGYGGKRMQIMLRAAAQSAKEKWTVADIKAAMNHAKTQPYIKQGSNEESLSSDSVTTWLSQVNVVIQPTVRAEASVIWESCRNAWKEENALPEEAARPIHAFKSRIVSLFMAIARDVRDNAGGDSPVVIRKPEDVLAYAQAHGPNVDTKRIKALLDSVAKRIKAINEEFSYEPFNTLQEYLNTDGLVDKLKLAKAERDALRNAPKATPSATQPNGESKQAKANTAPKAPRSGPQKATSVEPVADTQLQDKVAAAIAASKANNPQPTPQVESKIESPDERSNLSDMSFVGLMDAQ